MRPTLSVVVMGYLNATTIERAVRSVVDQADDDVEVVVVTSGGDDSAERVRRAFPAIAVVESPDRLLPGGARNAGIRASRGAVVAFLAADCAAEAGWVDARRRAHADGHPVVACAVTNGERRSPAAWGFHFGIYRRRLPGRAPGVVPASDAAAHGCSFDRSLLERMGGFDERVEVGEDSLAAEAAEALGVAIWYEPQVRTRHWGPRSTVDLAVERYRRGRVRGRDVGPVADSWWALARQWWSTPLFLPRLWREAGPDRRWVLAAFPWLMLDQAAFLVGAQVEGRRRRR